MPTLNWIGKQAVVNHHNEVPFHLLRCDPDLSVGDPDSGNLLVEGDNLLALKALLPYYAGKVKCIYIDPPYNTGNENWVYNDNVNSPEMKEWLGRVVGKEMEDQSRHDKWLCMMYPRLVLLRELLSEDGSLWVSIDDNEVEHARVILNEIFGASNFVATVIWQKVFSPKNSAKYLSEDHDYVLLYTKNKDRWKRNLLPRSERQDLRYKNPDDDPRGPWTSGDLSARNYYGAGTYPVTSPAGRIIDGPPTGRYWLVSKEKFLKLEQDNRIWWGEDGNNIPRLKRFLSEVKAGLIPQTFWSYVEVGHTQQAKKELLELCDFESSDDVFVTPKPTRLIQRILQIATGPEDLVLDSFAGTGTSGQAVLEQNRLDGGHRRFILIEMDPQIAQTITEQRLKNVILGYKYQGTDRLELLREKLTVTTFKQSARILAQMDELRDQYAGEYDRFEKKIEKGDIVFRGVKKITGFKEGIGGGFRYCQLGPTLFDARGQIQDNEVSYEDLARHVFFSETGAPLPTDSIDDAPLLGIHQSTAIYLLYNGILGDKSTDGGNVLTPAVLATFPPHDGQRIIYGHGCTLDRAQLKQANIIFRQIPYDIAT